VTGARPGDGVAATLVAFGAELRAGGIEVGPGRVQDAIRSLELVELDDRVEVYHALRCTMASRVADLGPFDEAFTRFWERRSSRGAAAPPAPRSEHESAAAAPGGGDGEAADADAPMAAVYSAAEVLRERDFAGMTDAELEQLRRMLAPLGRLQPRRRSRRLTAAAGGGVLDHRRTLRAAMRTQGVPLERAWRRPKLIPRKLIFLCDVSGSMEPYARAMVLFLQAMTAAGRRVEAFAFGTRLHRLTPFLAGRDPRLALALVGAEMPDWGGGTRIGDSLKAYNRDYGRRALTRGAVVVIVSDGWERGDLGLLDHELARIHRAAHLLVWVNPLKGHAGFEPLAGGMRTAMAHVDLLLEGHNVAALESLARVLASVAQARPTAARAAPATTTRARS
jgi:uncharacterized protein